MTGPFPWLVARITPKGVLHTVSGYATSRMTGATDWAPMCRPRDRYAIRPEDGDDGLESITAAEGPVCARCRQRVRARLEQLEHTADTLDAIDQRSRAT